MKLLIDKWGKAVSRQQLLDDLYAFDPNGGAQDKIIDVWVSKLRAKIEAAGFDLLIITHRGSGFELRGRMSVAA